MENEKNKSAQDAEKVVSFKKSKFSKVLIIFAAICLLFCAVAFDNGQILAGIIALIQVCLFIASWLMGMQIRIINKSVFRSFQNTLNLCNKFNSDTTTAL